MAKTMQAILCESVEAVIQDANRGHMGCHDLTRAGQELMGCIAQKIQLNNDLCKTQERNAYPGLSAGPRLSVPSSIPAAAIADILNGYLEIYVVKERNPWYRTGTLLVAEHGYINPDPRLIIHYADAVEYGAGSSKIGPIKTRLRLLCDALPDKYTQQLKNIKEWEKSEKA